MENKRKYIFERKPALTLFLIVLIGLFLIDLISAFIFISKKEDIFRIKHSYFHHGLKPNIETTTTWNTKDHYTFVTNSMGFRDKKVRKVELNSNKRRIVLIGDSHTEGVGVDYENSFAGILNSNIDTTKIKILNAGVIGYSPKLYYLKIKYLIEEIGLNFDELIVFIDISDIQNELVFANFNPGKKSAKDIYLVKLKAFLSTYSFIYHFISNSIEDKRRKEFYKKRNKITENPRTDLYYSFFDEFNDNELIQNEDFHSIGTWYLDIKIFDKWGRKGLILAKWHMVALADLCKHHGIKMTISIHPWPIQIVARDWNSIQVQFWEKFASDYDVNFINFFPILQKESETINTIKEYYFSGDVHFNDKGHKLIANELIKVID
ncbi:MAG: hypothetical protein K8R74_12575 [Bacteroidales bacterium]|nr:hypothetical protein [Bacteroidales bacterium]